MVIRLDRFTKAILTLLVVGVWGLLLSFVFQGQPVAAQGNANVVKWEYAWTLNGLANNGKAIDEAGQNGWELVAVTFNSNTESSRQYYKRPIK
jgi:hypothetical protein